MDVFLAFVIFPLCQKDFSRRDPRELRAHTRNDTQLAIGEKRKTLRRRIVANVSKQGNGFGFAEHLRRDRANSERVTARERRLAQSQRANKVNFVVVCGTTMRGLFSDFLDQTTARTFPFLWFFSHEIILSCLLVGTLAYRRFPIATHSYTVSWTYRTVQEVDIEEFEGGMNGISMKQTWFALAISPEGAFYRFSSKYTLLIIRSMQDWPYTPPFPMLAWKNLKNLTFCWQCSGQNRKGQECISLNQWLETRSSPPPGRGRWSLFECRLGCFEWLLSVCRVNLRYSDHEILPRNSSKCWHFQNTKCQQCPDPPPPGPNVSIEKMSAISLSIHFPNVSMTDFMEGP